MEPPSNNAPLLAQSVSSHTIKGDDSEELCGSNESAYQSTGVSETSTLIDSQEKGATWSNLSENALTYFSNSASGDDTKNSTRRRLWTPFVFRVVPISFLVAFAVVVIVILEVVLQLSDGHNGFEEPSPSVQSFATYTPLVIFIFAGWYWQVIDIEVKKLAPWSQMTRGKQAASPTPPSNPLLLDYIGAGYVAVLRQSLKNRHWHVILAVAGSATFSVTAILATSIFSIEPRTFPTAKINLQYTGRLDVSAFDDTDTNRAWLKGFLDGEPLPTWQTENYVAEPFQAVDAPRKNTFLIGDIAAYGANLDCYKPDSIKADSATNNVNGTFHLTLQLHLERDSCVQVVNATDAFVQASARGR
jgi:hypothetical protein